MTDSKNIISQVLKKTLSGKLHFSFSKALKLYIGIRLFTETSKVQMFSLLMVLLNWEISMFLKCFKMECALHRQEHHITQALKFGKGINMVESVIYGQPDAFCMRCVHSIHLSEQKISLDSIEKLSLAIMIQSLPLILLI